MLVTERHLREEGPVHVHRDGESRRVQVEQSVHVFRDRFGLVSGTFDAGFVVRCMSGEVVQVEQEAGPAVLDEVRDALGAQAHNGESRCLCFADHLSKGLGAVMRANLVKVGPLIKTRSVKDSQAREREDVCARVRRCELLALAEAEEERAELVLGAQGLCLCSRRTIANKDELASRPVGGEVGVLQSSEGFDEQAEVLLPRDSADVEDDELAWTRSRECRRGSKGRVWWRERKRREVVGGAARVCSQNTRRRSVDVEVLWLGAPRLSECVVACFWPEEVDVDSLYAEAVWLGRF